MDKEELYEVLDGIIDEHMGISPVDKDDVAEILCEELENELGRKLSEDEREFVDCCFETDEIIRHLPVGLNAAIERWEEATS